MSTNLWAVIEGWRDSQLFPVSQSALAERVGVSRSAMSQWKSGQARPTPEKLKSLSDVTRIPYDRLLSAVVQDLGYTDGKAGGEHADSSAPITQAGQGSLPTPGDQSSISNRDDGVDDRASLTALDGEAVDKDDHMLAARDRDDDDEAEAQQGEA